MKYTAAVAALLPIATVRADAPPYFNEPPFAVSTHPAAAGLVQMESACVQSGAAGVMCAPASNMLFATGMNGDEDLGEDITMKGNKFHFNQNLVQSKFATGMNGDEDLGEDITMKGNKFHFNQNLAQFATGMNGDEDLGEDITMKGNKFHFNQAPESHALFATGMNGDEDLGEDITMKGNKFHFNQEPSLVQWDAKGLPAIPYPDEKMSEPKVKKEGWDNGYDEPEQVLQMDAKIAKHATTFY